LKRAFLLQKLYRYSFEQKEGLDQAKVLSIAALDLPKQWFDGSILLNKYYAIISA
jgi:hypothetical protein